MNASADAPTRKRFGQGNQVDRARPHVFHRDYWPLKLIRRGVEEFFRDAKSVRNGSELRHTQVRKADRFDRLLVVLVLSYLLLTGLGLRAMAECGPGASHSSSKTVAPSSDSRRRLRKSLPSSRSSTAACTAGSAARRPRSTRW